MRISLGTLLLTVTLIALVCIVVIQNSRSAKRIALLETELKAKEIELAQFVLRQTGRALYGDEKLSDDEQREHQQYQIAETILKLWYHGDLILEHGAKLGRSGMIYDEDPAVRARQLIGEFQFEDKYVQSFVESKIEKLLAIAEQETIEFIKEYIEIGDFSELEQMFFADMENTPKFESKDDFARRIDEAIKNKPLAKQ